MLSFLSLLSFSLYFKEKGEKIHVSTSEMDYTYERVLKNTLFIIGCVRVFRGVYNVLSYSPYCIKVVGWMFKFFHIIGIVNYSSSI